MKLKTRVVPSAATQALRPKMWSLYQEYYQLDEAVFLQRFEVNQYYALYEVEGELVGFTALRSREFESSRGKVMCIYIGQSCILQQYRNRSLIPQTCVSLVARSYRQNPLRPIYLWCDSLTYKPYLAFSKATTYTYPSHKRATPEHIQSLINQLGTYYYGEKFNPGTGTVKKEVNIVNDPSAIIRPQDRQEPAIDFYARKNPHYLEGNGLITITQASVDNFMYCAVRCLKKQLCIKKSPRPSKSISLNSSFSQP
ncbi:MAG: hypothetical protein KDC44_08500 [Phaeodactylibacter sp.]|nr:hypothetical protein [Phaeodactylibacter sp.]